MRGASSFTRFLVDGRPPPDYAESYPPRILRHAFREIDEAGDAEISVGWVDILDALDNRFEGESYFRGGYIAMALRMDVRKVPPRALAWHCRAAESEIRRREGRAFLPRARRREIRDQVRARLLRRAIPVSSAYDVVWNPSARVVALGSLSRKACEALVDLFRRTFDLRLMPMFPYQLSLAAVSGVAGAAQRLEALVPSDLTRDPSGG
jgi:DNA recombination-dependent growth factor C